MSFDFSDRINKYNAFFNKKSGEKSMVQSSLKNRKEELKQKKLSLYNIEQAQSILQEVSKQTQEQIRYHIEDIVSIAIESVFGDEYKFKLDFIIKRNKVECEIYLQDKDDNKIKMQDANGGGIVDLVSFALRVALWSLKTGKKNNTIILDEPFKFLSKDLIDKAGIIIKKLSDELGIQFIIVTHIDAFVEYSDKIFSVKKEHGISYVRQI